MAQLITLYRGEIAPEVVLEIPGAVLDGALIDLEITGQPISAAPVEFFLSTEAGLDLISSNLLRFYPTSEMVEALPLGQNTAVDVFRHVDGRREKIGATSIEVMGAGKYKGASQMVVLGPVLQGPPGWTPILAMVEDGARTVMQVQDWIGGSGTKPAAPVYIGATGLVATAAEASDLKALALTQAQAAAATATGAAGAAAGSATTSITKAVEATDAATLAVQAAGTSTSAAGLSTTKADAAAASATQANGFAAGAASVAWAMADLRAKGLTIMPRLIIDTEMRAYHLRGAEGPILTSGDFASFVAAV
ncbi:hypothetical protein ACO2RV_04485 [Ancylobacter sp. VNQ12]|uniref:hypothetical protein n=1 Tax=Ancylobacter sp. VNQ12 TaxID=3400920 RepID=UPI003C1102B7